MAKVIEVYVHGEGTPSKTFKIAEDATIADLVKQAQQAGHLKPEDGHAFKICLENEDDERDHHQPLHACGVGHKSHVHCHRCKHINVTVAYNGVTKSHSFTPAATGQKIKKWALKEFDLKGADASDKVLRFENETELDPEAHIGTFASFPACSVQLLLTALVEVNG